MTLKTAIEHVRTSVTEQRVTLQMLKALDVVDNHDLTWNVSLFFSLSTGQEKYRPTLRNMIIDLLDRTV